MSELWWGAHPAACRAEPPPTWAGTQIGALARVSSQRKGLSHFMAKQGVGQGSHPSLGAFEPIPSACPQCTTSGLSAH